MKAVIFRKLYDLYVLKLFWLIFIVLSIFYLYHRDWVSGAFFAVAWFLIGGIGGGLYPEMSPKELAQGTIPSKEELANADSEISPEESYLIAKAHYKLSALIALSAVVILWHYNLRWYFVIPLGILVGYIFYALTIVCWMSILFIRRKLKK
jgi:hypothetical protein